MRKYVINKNLNEVRDNEISGSECVFKTYHPSEPEAGFTGCAQCDVKWGHVRWSLQGLELSRRLAGWAGAVRV